MAYISPKAQEFTSLGYFNGFPFLVQNKPDYLGSQGIFESGQYSGSLLTGTDESLHNTVNHFWNLAAFVVDFKIETNKAPSSYTTGYAYSDDRAPSVDQSIKVRYDVINSADGSDFPPQHRIATEVTGRTQDLVVDLSGLVSGSGNNYTSCWVSRDIEKDVETSSDFTIPITIQPYNTGAFVITSDTGVADYFENLVEFGTKKEFQMETILDMGSGLNESASPMQPFESGKTIVKTGWHIVPAKDWEFSVTSGSLTAIYYEYS